MTKKNKDTPVSARPAGGTRRIFGMAKQLGLDIDDLRGIAKDISGIPSISQLTNHQKNELIRRLGQKIKAANKLRNAECGMRNERLLNQQSEISNPKSKKSAISNRARRPQGENVTYLANSGQKWKIVYLARDLGWLLTAEEEDINPSINNITPRLRGFIQKTTKTNKTTLHRLTSDEATTIIETLKSMVQGNRGSRVPPAGQADADASLQKGKKKNEHSKRKIQ